MSKPQTIAQILQDNAATHSNLTGIKLYNKMAENTEYRQIERATKIKLVQINKTLADLARTMNISQALLWKHMAGRTKSVTPAILKEMINAAITRL